MITQQQQFSQYMFRNPRSESAIPVSNKDETEHMALEKPSLFKQLDSLRKGENIETYATTNEAKKAAAMVSIDSLKMKAARPIAELDTLKSERKSSEDLISEREVRLESTKNRKNLLSKIWNTTKDAWHYNLGTGREAKYGAPKKLAKTQSAYDTLESEVGMHREQMTELREQKASATTTESTLLADHRKELQSQAEMMAKSTGNTAESEYQNLWNKSKLGSLFNRMKNTSLSDEDMARQNQTIRDAMQTKFLSENPTPSADDYTAFETSVQETMRKRIEDNESRKLAMEIEVQTLENELSARLKNNVRTVAVNPLP